MIEENRCAVVDTVGTFLFFKKVKAEQQKKKKNHLKQQWHLGAFRKLHLAVEDIMRAHRDNSGDSESS